MQPPLPVDAENGADDSGVQLLDASAQQIDDLSEGLAGRGRLQDFVLYVSQSILRGSDRYAIAAAHCGPFLQFILAPAIKDPLDERFHEGGTFIDD